GRTAHAPTITTLAVELGAVERTVEVPALLLPHGDAVLVRAPRGDGEKTLVKADQEEAPFPVMGHAAGGEIVDMAHDDHSLARTDDLRRLLAEGLDLETVPVRIENVHVVFADCA